MHGAVRRSGRDRDQQLLQYFGMTGWRAGVVHVLRNPRHSGRATGRRTTCSASAWPSSQPAPASAGRLWCARGGASSCWPGARWCSKRWRMGLPVPATRMGWFLRLLRRRRAPGSGPGVLPRAGAHAGVHVRATPGRTSAPPPPDSHVRLSFTASQEDPDRGPGRLDQTVSSITKEAVRHTDAGAERLHLQQQVIASSESSARGEVGSHLGITDPGRPIVSSD